MRTTLKRRTRYLHAMRRWRRGRLRRDTAAKHVARIATAFVLLLASVAVHAAGRTEKAGDLLRIVIPAAGLGAALLYEEGYEGSIQWLKSFATTEVITGGLKLAIDEERPNGGCCNAFPSGHASAAFMGAEFIRVRYGWAYGIPAYVAATYVGYGRVESDKHYWHDVIAGAAIGIGSSHYFTTPCRGITVTPVVEARYAGFLLTIDW